MGAFEVITWRELNLLYTSKSLPQTKHSCLFRHQCLGWHTQERGMLTPFVLRAVYFCVIVCGVHAR